MQTASVPALSMAGMVFSLIISIGVPAALCILVRCKTKAKISGFFIGCGVFLVFAMILEQILHAVVLGTLGTKITGNIFLYGLYGGLAAALFEETGRFLAMKFLMKKQLNRRNALMYGVGHGGLEAILIAGLASVNNLAASFMINSNQLQAALSVLDESQKELAVQKLSALWTLPSYQFFMAGVERIFAIALQIAFSVLVYQAVKSGKKKFFLAAMGLHFLVDFVTVISADKLPVWGVELLVFAMTAMIGYFALCIYKADNESENA